MQSTARVLVCFAVEDEARHFRKKVAPDAPCEIIITGIGRRNAEQSLQRALATSTPALVLSCGFAGGLHPELDAGTVVFESSSNSDFFTALRASGAEPARFHTADRIASTAQMKLDLRRSTGADAVEMESAIIREICAQRNLPAATIRIISDAADEDLPLDFNRLITSDQRLNYLKLAWALAKSPGTVARLWNFRRKIDGFAAKLGAVLSDAVAAFGRRH